jgi:hypothetical protein
MEPRDQWSPRHSTLMRQRAVVLAILQRSVRDTPPARPAPLTNRRRFGDPAPNLRRPAS